MVNYCNNCIQSLQRFCLCASNALKKIPVVFVGRFIVTLNWYLCFVLKYLIQDISALYWKVWLKIYVFCIQIFDCAMYGKFEWIYLRCVRKGFIEDICALYWKIWLKIYLLRMEMFDGQYMWCVLKGFIWNNYYYYILKFLFEEIVAVYWPIWLKIAVNCTVTFSWKYLFRILKDLIGNNCFTLKSLIDDVCAVYLWAKEKWIFFSIIIFTFNGGDCLLGVLSLSNCHY
jgi:hypothetical protein